MVPQFYYYYFPFLSIRKRIDTRTRTPRLHKTPHHPHAYFDRRAERCARENTRTHEKSGDKNESTGDAGRRSQKAAKAEEGDVHERRVEVSSSGGTIEIVNKAVRLMMPPPRARRGARRRKMKKTTTSAKKRTRCEDGEETALGVKTRGTSRRMD